MYAQFVAWLHAMDASNFQNQLEALFHLGHFLYAGYPSKDEEALQRIRNDIKSPTNPRFKYATKSLQSFSDLNSDGDFGLKTAKSLKNRYCGCPDIEMVGGQPKWSINELVVWHDMDSLSEHDEKAAYLQACAMWAKHIPLDFTWWKEGMRKPNLFAHARRIDGAGNVLAWHVIPPPDANENTQIEMRVDTGESWREFWFLVAVLCHEIGHGLGLSHSRFPEAIMYAYMNGTREPDQHDIAAIQSIYGKRIDPLPNPDTPPEPDPVPNPGSELVSTQNLGTIKDGRTLIVEHWLR